MEFLLIAIIFLKNVAGNLEEVIGRPGDEITLSCPVNTQECGEYHSLKWYHEDTRVYVYSPMAQFSNPEGALMDRCLDASHQHLGSSCARGSLLVTDTSADLQISPLELRDEGEYRCEITYLDIVNNCPVVHFTDVRTVAAPGFVAIYNSENEDITGQVVGPYTAGSEAAFSCKSGGGKPAPSVSWTFGDEVLEGETEVSEDTQTGSMTVTNNLVVTLEVEQVGERLTCRVEHEILEDPLAADIQVDVNVPVSSVSIAPVDPGQEGVEMLLTCTAVGGRPAPVFSWTVPDTVQFQLEESSSLVDDQTFDAVSKLTFTPSSEENGKEVSCQAINEFMNEALEDKAELFVKYAPHVLVQEGNETVSSGDEFTIECEVDANPADLTSIQWFHNDNALDENNERFNWENTDSPFLHIHFVKPIDSGEYTCSAGNIIGMSRSALAFHLDVTSVVQSVTIQADTTGSAGEEMTIVCTSRGSQPVASVDWVLAEVVDYDVEEVSKKEEDNTFETTSRFTFTPSYEINGLEVSCQAINDAMEEPLEDKADLNILYLPIVTNEEGNLTVNTGEQLIIDCMVEANPVNLTLVQWFHNEEPINTEDKRFEWDASEVASLNINPVHASDSGEYYCMAENEIGQGQSELVMLNVIAVVESVVIEAEAGVEGGEMLITCIATGGRPEASIIWNMPEGVLFSEEEEVQILEDETFETVSKVHFIPSAEENEKKVTCQAINDVMVEAVEHESELNILYKPRVDIDDENKTLTAGDKVTLDCLIDANPMNLSLVEWYHNEEIMNMNEDRFEDGNEDTPSLTIDQITPEDVGDYYCLAQNQVGQSRSNLSVSIEVIYPPIVEIRKEHTGPLSEEDDMNVTLHCDLIDGNPLELVRVSWFMNGELIRQIPDSHCYERELFESDDLINEEFLSEASDYELGSGIGPSTLSDLGSGMEIGSGVNPDSIQSANHLCDVDPTELFLQHVTRDFSGNFSCAGSNIAGEGPESAPVNLNVMYLPGEATISQEDNALAGESVTLLCNVADQGYPSATHVIWTRGVESLKETSFNLTLDNLAAASQGNISCAAINDIGQGEEDTLQLLVFAPPNYIQSLPETSTFVSHDSDFSLQCQVECSPFCNLFWKKNDELIDLDNDQYFIEESFIQEDIETDQFSFTSSKISWNLDTHPLDHNEQNFTVSCSVEETAVGVSISSSTAIEIEYSPENIEISSTYLSIEENKVIEPIFCAGDGVPEPSIVWKFNDEKVTTENTLDFPDPIQRTQAGDYFCQVTNIHGEEVATVTIDVLYAPECTIDYTWQDEEIVLLCSAAANPKDVKFWWEKENITFDGQHTEDTLESEVRVKIMNESSGTYYCHVENSVGKGDPCMIDLTESIMLYGLSEEVVVILIAVAGSVIILLLIILITACLYCREKTDDKGKVKMRKNKSKSPLLKDDKIHADSSFYENLPFKGLKSPPKQVLDDRNSDMMDYADADYLDIYANGPLKYREASEKNATLRRQKIEERKAVKSELL